MQTLHFSITINAPREKVWKAMLEDKSYREWTNAFNPGSYYVGTWEKGSKIQFLGPGENGAVSGMTSEIADNKLHEFVSIHHLGVVENGVEDTSSPAAREWQGYENYTFKDQGGKTEVVVDIDVNNEFADYMNQAWPKALEILKQIAEK